MVQANYNQKSVALQEQLASTEQTREAHEKALAEQTAAAATAATAVEALRTDVTAAAGREAESILLIRHPLDQWTCVASHLSGTHHNQ